MAQWATYYGPQLVVRQEATREREPVPQLQAWQGGVCVCVFECECGGPGLLVVMVLVKMDDNNDDDSSFRRPCTHALSSSRPGTHAQRSLTSSELWLWSTS